MKRRRVVITGIGPVTPVGTGREVFWNALLDGQSGVRRITRFDPYEFPVKIAGEVPDFDALKYMDRKDARRFALFAQYAVAAARLALEDAGLQHGDHRQMGACFGSSIAGGGEVVEEDMPQFLKRGYGAINPLDANNFTTHVGTSAVCQVLGLQGPRASISSGCTAGQDVVQWARQEIQSGAAEALVVGCSDAPLYPFSFGILCHTRIYSSSQVAPRPFDWRHDGSAISEGAGAVVVEEMEHALNRGATIYAELLGHGGAAEMGEIWKHPSGGGAIEAMHRALNDAALDPHDMDVVFPIAVGTREVDVSDAKAIHDVFGDRSARVPVPAILSSLGHMIAASSLVQIIAASLSIRSQRVPPTINFERCAPGCQLDCVPNRSRFSRIRNAMVFSRSMSRTFASVILGAAPSSAGRA